MKEFNYRGRPWAGAATITVTTMDPCTECGGNRVEIKSEDDDATVTTVVGGEKPPKTGPFFALHAEPQTLFYRGKPYKEKNPAMLKNGYKVAEEWAAAHPCECGEPGRPMAGPEIDGKVSYFVSCHKCRVVAGTNPCTCSRG